MQQRKLVQVLAQKVDARLNCQKSGNTEWFDKHEDAIIEFIKNYFPSGSGFDNGTTIDLEKSTGEKLVFHTNFHHMTEHGMYDGWTEHTISVTASLMGGFHMKISGPNRNDIKDLIGDEFHHALNTLIGPPVSADAQDLISA